MTIISILVTLLHASEERWGNGGPLWDYFGDLAGYWPSRKAGLFFTILMPAAFLSVLAWFAYHEQYGWAASLLLGARLGDWIVNHGTLAYFCRPNPGVITAWMLYSVESVYLYHTFGIEYLSLGIVGVLMFAGIVPLFSVIGTIKEPYGD